MPTTLVPAAVTGLPASRRSILRGAAALPLAALPACVPQPASAAGHPDARLLALGAEHERLRAEDARLCVAIDTDPSLIPAWEAMGGKVKEIGDRIAAEPASTLEGFMVKARALASIYHEGFTAESMESLDGDTTDWALVRSILFGLIALGSRQEGGAA
jgi:hypothetical protein